MTKAKNLAIASLEDSGLEVLEIDQESRFTARNPHNRDIGVQVEGLRRLTRAFVEKPGTVLQELVNAAVDLCQADSAGISIERPGHADAELYQWVATAGEYSSFLNAILPRYPSACSLCLERGRPQLFRVSQPFFDLMGVVAPIVTDGLLLPWQEEETRGTIWIMAHTRAEAFDGGDLHLMQVLADFAVMAIRQERQQRALMEQASIAAAASMANELAHQINNPLQSLTNLVYLAGNAPDEGKARLAFELSEHVDRLSVLVKKLLAIPSGTGTVGLPGLHSEEREGQNPVLDHSPA